MNTLVTAFLNGGKLNNRIDEYLTSINTLIETGEPIIMFVDKTTQEYFEERDTLKIYSYNYKEEFPYNELVEKLRHSSSFLDSAAWVKGASHSKYEAHNPIIMSKPFMVKKAIKLNPFKSTKFVWYDGGLLKNRNYFGMGSSKFKKEELTYLFQLFTEDQMYFMSTNYPSNSPEIHGFRREGILNILGDFPNYVCRGGNFGGGKLPLLEFVEKYSNLLRDTLEKGYMGTEETIFTILHFLEPALYKNYIFNSYGDIYTSIRNQSINHYYEKF